MIHRYHFGIKDAFPRVEFYTAERVDGDWVKFEDHERETQALQKRVSWLEDVILKAACSEQLGLEFNMQDFIYLKPIPGCSDEVSSIYGGVQSVIDTPRDFKTPEEQQTELLKTIDANGGSK